jgi:hypothetical protein
MAGGGYGGQRDDAWLGYIQGDIDAFAANYDANKVTMFFFPGGMGSQLYRDDYANPSPSHDFNLKWLDFEILFGAAADLVVLPDGTDKGSRFVVARGFIDFCLHPYDQLQQWCDSKGIQLFTFGYDWRRSSGDAANLFLDGLLPRLDAAIGQARSTGQPKGNLQNYAFVGHSLGGMVVKLALNRGNADYYVNGMKCAVTVASPFYGYGGQVHRYLIGDKDLAWTLADINHNNLKMARIICTMPGGYEFIYMSEATYQANAAAFAADPEFKLLAYPCRATDGTAADPYHPRDQGDSVYYPLFDNNDMQMLANAIPVAEAVAKPLEADVAAKFFNIRGVQVDNTPQRQPLNNTAVGSTWARVSKLNFDPDRNADPITDDWGPGDDTQPAWTTRLLQLNSLPGHVLTVKGDEQHLQHMQMMSNVDVQDELQRILGAQALFPLVAWIPPDRATRSEFERFVSKLPKESEKLQKPEAQRRWELLEYIFSFSRKDRERLMWRWVTDRLSSPRPPERSSPPRPRRPAKPQDPKRKGSTGRRKAD